MNLFDTTKQSFSMNPNHNRREPIGRINTNINNNNNNNNKSSIPNSSLNPNELLSNIKSIPNGSENIELFLRYRSELYLNNSDYETALFYAERLLSSSDNLYNRLLVSKCYNSLTKYNRAYHVLQSIVRETQIKYQKYLENKIKKFNNNNNNNDSQICSNKFYQKMSMSVSEQPPMNIPQQIHETHNVSFGVDPLTPISRHNDNGNISDIGFAFNTMNDTSMNMSSSNNNNNINNINNSNNNNSDMSSEPFGASFLKKLNTPKSMVSKENMSMSMSVNNNNNNNNNNKSLIENDEIINEINNEYIGILFEARYFISLICFKLGRYDECEEFLLGKKYSDSKTIELRIPNNVYGIYLLAKVFHKSNRFELAIKYYNKCIQLDSYHIGAIMALSQLGKNPGLTNQSKQNKCLLSKHCVIPINNNNNEKTVIEMEKYDKENYNKIELLFNNLTWGYFKLQMYCVQDALTYFNKLPLSYFNSAFILNSTALCYYEMNDYNRAICNWNKQIELFPYNLLGMDYYSTALWHLKKSKELTLLSQHCSEIDRNSLQTWMVMGNCFSLHKSHDLAIKFFHKAASISGNSYAYPYTLSGHEYVVNEDFDNALKSFENAIRINNRHYNAWYGLGNIYQFQQNYNDALYHFNKAILINPNSSVLYVCIASIYKLQLKYKLALKYANKALQLTNNNGNYNLKARLEKANIYILMNEYKLAIKEFKLLLQIIPNEWKIHFHLGEVYLQIGQKNLALLSFNRAMALNPKDKNTIKHAIQNVYNNNNICNNNHNNNYKSILIQEDNDNTYNNNNHNRNRNRNINNNIDDDDDDDDDMLDDESVIEDDDNDQFMNITHSNDISSVNANIHSNSHSNSLSPR